MEILYTRQQRGDAEGKAVLFRLARVLCHRRLWKNARGLLPEKGDLVCVHAFVYMSTPAEEEGEGDLEMDRSARG